MTSKERDPMWDFEIKDKLIYLWTTIVNLYGEIEPLESYQEENKIRARKCCEHILNHLERLEQLELEVHCKNNSIKTLEALHKSQIENYLQKENKLLDELIIRKQQIKILKKALPYYDIKVLCNAGRITKEELEVLLKYEEVE